MAEKIQKMNVGFKLHPEGINRKGRPKKGTTMTDLLWKELREGVVELTDADNQTLVVSKKQAVAYKLIDLALLGDLPAIKYIFDRIDGVLKASVEQALPLPNKIELVTEYANENITAGSRTAGAED
jgi:hypothetical protein